MGKLGTTEITYRRDQSRIEEKYGLPSGSRGRFGRLSLRSRPEWNDLAAAPGAFQAQCRLLLALILQLQLFRTGAQRVGAHPEYLPSLLIHITAPPAPTSSAIPPVCGSDMHRLCQSRVQLYRKDAETRIVPLTPPES